MRRITLMFQVLLVSLLALWIFSPTRGDQKSSKSPLVNSHVATTARPVKPLPPSGRWFLKCVPVTREKTLVNMCQRSSNDCRGYCEGYTYNEEDCIRGWGSCTLSPGRPINVQIMRVNCIEGWVGQCTCNDFNAGDPTGRTIPVTPNDC